MPYSALLCLMVHIDEKIVALIRSFAKARGLSESYASRLVTGSGDTIKRIEDGMSLTGRRATGISQCVSDNWPEDRPWPADIPRPEPTVKEGVEV